MSKRLALSLSAALSFCGAEAALAHHSYGMFDRQKQQVLSGVVKTFDWTNPHSRIALIVPTQSGSSDVWDIELGPPGQLIRSGWKRLSLKPGDKVEATVNPLRDGRPGGHLMRVVTADGQVLGDVIFDKPPPR